MGSGGGIDHVSPLATLTAEAMGHESLAPCFNPHLNLAWMWPLAVIIMTLLFSMLSAAHLTKPVGGHARRSKHVHWYSRVMRS